MKITWYGHSCFRLETGNSVILIDPFLKGNPTFEKSGIAWDEATAGVTHVALTLGNPNGIIVRPKEGKTLYHMGDTDMFGGMALIAEFHKPDIGIVPIGDRFTMGARSAAFTCKKFFAFEMILPCHYGTFPGMLDPDADKFVAEMKDHNVVVPKVGQTLTV